MLDFTINNLEKIIKKKYKNFSVDFNHNDTNEILDIHKYSIYIYIYIIMFGLIRKTVHEIIN